MDQYSQSKSKCLKIAVVGSGISGMSAAWLLSKKHNVTVYETEERLGGHSNTVEIIDKQKAHWVDTGFIVYNEVNYPNLTRLLDHLNVATQKSDMSFGVSINGGDLEYGSRNLNAVLGQRSNLISGRFWRMLKDIQIFCNHSENFLANGSVENQTTLGGFLSQGSYGAECINQFILPMGAAIWSTKSDEMLEQPAVTFLRFFASHGLMRFRNRIPWRTVVGGSRNYVQKITASYADKVRLGLGVRKVLRHPGGVKIIDVFGGTEKFDAVVIATHADQALSMLADPDTLERSLLGAFRYTENHVVLHSDRSLMPKRQQVWSSWNFMGNSDRGVGVTYWMNSLQKIPPSFPLFVSVNPKTTPDHSRVHKTFDYQHPMFDLNAWGAQKCLWQLQNHRNTWYCGSYFGYGFHEDALQSGLAVAEDLGGVRRPWTLENESNRIHRFSVTQDIAA